MASSTGAPVSIKHIGDVAEALARRVRRRLVEVRRRRHGDDEQAALLGVQGGVDAGGVAPGVAVHDETVAGVERLMGEELVDVPLGALQPQQLTHSPGAEHVVPHRARVGQRIEADVAAVAGEGLLARQHGVPGAVEVDEPAVGECAGEALGDDVEVLVVCRPGSLDQLDEAVQVVVGHRVAPWCLVGGDQVARSDERIS